MLLRSRVELVDVTELGGGGASDLNAIINPGFFPDKMIYIGTRFFFQNLNCPVQSVVIKHKA